MRQLLIQKSNVHIPAFTTTKENSILQFEIWLDVIEFLCLA